MTSPHPAEVLLDGLGGYVRAGTLTQHQAVVVREAIANGRNILISGGCAAGKTTLCNVLLGEWAAIHPTHEMLVLQGPAELSGPWKNIILVSAEPDKAHRLLLAIRPNGFTLGEVRGGHDTHTLLKAWDMRMYPGFSTIHASGAEEALQRIGRLLTEETGRTEVELMARAIDYVLHLDRCKQSPSGRCATLYAVSGHNGTACELREVSEQQ